MKKINCIIIEDEPLAMERTVQYVQRVSFLQLQASFDNATDAIEYVSTNTVQLIFLDIHLGQISGIDFLQKMQPTCAVILLTAYHQYAVKSYDFNVTDYLLKPFTFERFEQAVAKVPQNIDITTTSIFIKSAHQIEKVILEDILFIEGKRDYRKLVLQNRLPIFTQQTFTSLEQELPSHIICRVHKSYMVSINKIDVVNKSNVHIQQHVIPISASYKKYFFERIQINDKQF
jgi:two-component system, LytTR family, response regulator